MVYKAVSASLLLLLLLPRIPVSFLLVFWTFSSFEPRLNVEQVTWSLFYRGHEKARRFWTSRQAMSCRLWRHCGPVTPLSPLRLPPSPFFPLQKSKLFLASNLYYLFYILRVHPWMGSSPARARSDDI